MFLKKNVKSIKFLAKGQISAWSKSSYNIYVYKKRVYGH